MLNMIEAWNALWTNISPKICGGKLNKAAGKRGRSRRRSAYALRRSRNTARAGRSPRSPRLPNCAVFWTARQMTFWGSGTELLSCRTLHRKKLLTCNGGRASFDARPPLAHAEIQFSCRSPHHRLRHSPPHTRGMSRSDREIVPCFLTIPPLHKGSKNKRAAHPRGGRLSSPLAPSLAEGLPHA